MSVRVVLVLAFAPLLAASAARTQDLSRDLPWRRVVPAVSSDVHLAAGWARLAAGWSWEAARRFREVVHAEDARAIAHLGLALALRDEPVRAARLCWEAIERLPTATPGERRLVEAYQRYFGVTRQPELRDRRFVEPPPRERARRLVADLEAIASRRGDDAAAARATALLAIERARLAPSNARVADDDLADALASQAAYLRATGAMPFLVPGYRDLLMRSLAATPDLADTERERTLARLPRHPRLATVPRAAVGPLPGFTGRDDAARWQPRRAPGFDLPRGLGGRGAYAEYAGKPLLVVFFLGFG